MIFKRGQDLACCLLIGVLTERQFYTADQKRGHKKTDDNVCYNGRL